MEIEQDKAIMAMKKKRPEAKYRDLIDAFDKLTKNIQLLGGGETAREQYKIKWIDTDLKKRAKKAISEIAE